jgi:GTP-binding protein HflX
METIHGNTTGLKAHQARALRNICRRRVPPSDFISTPLARTLTELSRDTGRRIGVLIDRSGEVDSVIVGDAHRVFLPDLGPRRAGAGRFRGVRLVHTSLQPDGLSEDDLTDLALLRLDAVVTLHVQDDGLPGRAWYAYLLPPGQDDDAVWRVERVERVREWTDDWLQFITDLEAQFTRVGRGATVEGAEGAILVGVTLADADQARRGLEELDRLAQTAGLNVLDSVMQVRKKLDGRTIIGSGKLQELIIRSMHLGADVLIFDRELSPSQLRNVAETTDLKVLDRTQLILDIFAQRAQSREGKLQVELAQLRYHMPRLAIMPTAMSRLTGGIGGRGPGETKLEINRRRAGERLTKLERQLAKLGKNRALRRARRKRNNLPVASIVGYTNAGKSTLLNRLTQSDVTAADQLFATLDPTSRRFRFPKAREILITDTVGFIHDLPATLINAFKATLEELDEAHMLLHVLDASHPEVVHQKQDVERTLIELGLDKPTLCIWNKADIADPVQLTDLIDRWGGLSISARTGAGCETLLTHVERMLFRVRNREQSNEEEPANAELPAVATRPLPR